MRALLPLILAGAAFLCADMPPEASARPQFARREGKACGYCHINPGGGGARNQRGLEYAKNEFSFPPRKGDLRSFTKERDRNAMLRANKLIDLDHTPAAVDQLRRLKRAVAKDEGARLLVEAKLHELDVRGNEILGQARRLLRGSGREEGVELIVLLTVEYKYLEVHVDAMSDLKELRQEKENKERIKKEQREARARLAYLQGVLATVDGKPDKARKSYENILKKYADTRAVKLAKRALGMKVKEDEEEEKGS